ncbi:Uncharacterised protein [Mycobacteroides abscessus]|nr:Uncharacterised protein [Mycobacteroides abscessus]
MTFSTGALPGAAASSLRLNHHVADTASPVSSVAGMVSAQEPSSSYTVAAVAGNAAAVRPAPPRTRAVTPPIRRRARAPRHHEPVRACRAPRGAACLAGRPPAAAAASRSKPCMGSPSSCARGLACTVVTP